MLRWLTYDQDEYLDFLLPTAEDLTPLMRDPISSRSEAVYWDGKNELGEQVASGVYICELATPTFKQTRQLVILK